MFGDFKMKFLVHERGSRRLVACIKLIQRHCFFSYQRLRTLRASGFSDLYLTSICDAWGRKDLGFTPSRPKNLLKATSRLPWIYRRCREDAVRQLSPQIHPTARLREQVEVQGSPLDANSKTAHLWNSLSLWMSSPLG